MVKGLKKLPHEYQVEEVGYLFLEKTKITWRFDRDVQNTNWKEHVNCSKFFSTGRCHQRTQRSLSEIVQAKMSHDTQTELFQFTDCQRMEQATTGPSINMFKNTLDRHWHIMGILS